MEMKHFYSVGNYSPGGEAFKEHSGEFEEAYLGDIDDEVSDWLQHRYDRTVTIHTTREVFLGSILSHLSNPLARTTDLQHSLSFVNLRTELPSSLLPTAAARGAPRHDQRSLVSLRKQCQNVALPIIRKTTSQAPSFILLDTEANSSH